MVTILKKLFGSSNDRYVAKLKPFVEKINAQELQYQKLTDDQLKNKTLEFKQRIAKGETVDELMVEAFAVVKNACRRMCGSTISYSGNEELWNMIPYDVQLIGGIVIHQGGIAEMQTGEGKTLTASLPLYLNALTGRNCQLVTTNDYLAKRDSEWIGSIFKYLGLTVGCIQNDQMPDERREQYNCDITYGTNSEFGFDYLRDMGMATDIKELVQRDHYFVIVDEIDSILIDEARTPLIISGPVEKSTHRFHILKDRVEVIFKKQRDLCNSLIAKAKEDLEKADVGSEAYKKAIMDVCLVRMGMPKNKQLMRMMEDPTIRKFVEKQEMMFHSDNHRGLLQEVREELYFSIDERYHDSDLTAKGRKTLNPNDPQSYIIPDIVDGMQKIDSRKDLDDAQKMEERQKLQENYDIKTEEIQNISQLLKAYCLYEKDVQYIVEDDKVIIVDENTGRSMPGRRFSEGLHQALEAKENVTIEKETQTLATITIQNYFRLYKKLGGMTGTAETEAGEFKEIYKLNVVAIPSNRPCKRIDDNDRIFKSQKDKYFAIIEEIRTVNATGRPILVGTPTVEVSEVISRLLKREKIEHSVLNARRHAQEAEVIARAGQRSAITIATNMAGRGTDIKLAPGMAELGGLRVIGAARHDSRRIDRQLRGRCARQGDPGSTVFFISLEDKLMRLFGSNRITGVLEKLGMKDGEQLESGMLTKVIEKAQKRVEQQNFSQRKRTLEYDDVMNVQRNIIYDLRKDILKAESPKSRLFDVVQNTLEDRLNAWVKPGKTGKLNVNENEIKLWLSATFPINFDYTKIDLSGATNQEKLADNIWQQIKSEYEKKEKLEDQARIRWLEQHIMLTAIDTHWKEHLHAMDHLRQSVMFSHMAQKDPLIEYKQQAFVLFDELTANIAQSVLNNMFRSATTLAAIEMLLHSIPQFTMSAEDVERMEVKRAIEEMKQAGMTPTSIQPEEVEEPKVEQYVRQDAKVGRNDLCPCGSGQKFKKCHGV